MESVTLSRAKKSLDIAAKVADNNKKLEDGKEYPINLSLLSADKDSVECLQGTVTFKNGVGRVSNNLYNHLGMGATLTIDGNGVVLNGSENSKFAVSSNFNGINIVGRERDEKESEKDIEGNAPSKEDLDIKNIKDTKNAHAKIDDKNSKQKRQEMQDLRAESNTLLNQQFQENLRNMPRLFRMLQRLEDINYDAARTQANARLALKGSNYSSTLIAAQDLESMHSQFHKLEQEIKHSNNQYCAECEYTANHPETMYSMSMNGGAKNSITLTKSDFATIMIGCISKVKEELEQKSPSDRVPSNEEIQARLFPNISWNPWEYLAERKALESKTKNWSLSQRKYKPASYKVVGISSKSGKLTLEKLKEAGIHPRARHTVKNNDGNVVDAHIAEKPERLAQKNKLVQDRQLGDHTDSFAVSKGNDKTISKNLTENGEENASAKEASSLISTHRAHAQTVSEEKSQFVELDKSPYANTHFNTGDTRTAQGESTYKISIPDSSSSEKNSVDTYEETITFTLNNLNETTPKQKITGANPEKAEDYKNDSADILPEERNIPLDHTSFDFGKFEEIAHEHQHSHENQEFDTELKLQNLEDEVDGLVQEQNAELDALDASFDERTLRLVLTHLKTSREEMRNELYQYSSILSADKSKTPVQRKRELLLKQDEIKKRQDKEFKDKLLKQKVLQRQLYARLLLKHAKKRGTLINNLSLAAKEMYQNTMKQNYVPEYDTLTQKAYTHISEEMERAKAQIQQQLDEAKKSGSTEKINNALNNKNIIDWLESQLDQKIKYRKNFTKYRSTKRNPSKTTESQISVSDKIAKNPEEYGSLTVHKIEDITPKSYTETETSALVWNVAIEKGIISDKDVCNSNYIENIVMDNIEQHYGLNASSYIATLENNISHKEEFTKHPKVTQDTKTLNTYLTELGKN